MLTINDSVTFAGEFPMIDPVVLTESVVGCIDPGCREQVCCDQLGGKILHTGGS